MTPENASVNAEQAFLTRFQADYLNFSSSHDLLPSVRDLSQRYRISPVTVTRGLKHLVQAGKIITKPGAGTFVAPSRSNLPFDASWQALALGARVPLGEETQILISQS